MTSATATHASRRITALIACLALVIGSLSFVYSGSQHISHAASAIEQVDTATFGAHIGHTAHKLAETHIASSEHCGSDAEHPSGCNIAGCCLAELQSANLLPHGKFVRGTNPRPLAIRAIRLLATSLPERPPRFI